MIISASYKTDIPAFYGTWFRNRLRAGFCKTVNPLNRDQHSTISLKRSDVESYVFWTKGQGPFLPVLDELHEAGFPFIVQYTINGYPRALETRVSDSDRAVEQMQVVSRRFGPRVAVWRYDTIVLSSLTDFAFHRRNFERLAEALSGTTDEVVVSFLQLYQKTKRNLDEAGRVEAFEWWDPTVEEKRDLLSALAQIAASNRMRLTICTQPDLVVAGVGESRCIDGERLMDLAGGRFPAKVKGMREGCGCYESKDIGDYDTCPHGCVYCYAVRDRDLALNRFKAHDPEGEYLFPVQPPKPARQLRLFGE
ncbi:MAG: DUF1848 domain-containing protein [Deltaproteobacteria bacterium]|nr:DUF1848 domain-containing protein [Deltaproteobacteria bacterium]